MSNSLDPDQSGRFDLAQRLSADDRSYDRLGKELNKAEVRVLMLGTLGKLFCRRYIEIFF